MILKPLRFEGDVAYVPLSRGYEAIIDAEDAPLVDSHNWFAVTQHNCIYAKREKYLKGGGRKYIAMHRVIAGAADEKVVDHINHNGLDNRKVNLRVCEHCQNIQNQRLRFDNSSGFKGVSWNSRRGKWRAQITLSGKRKELGLFDSPERAYEVYCEASEKHYGEFGYTPRIQEGKGDE